MDVRVCSHPVSTLEAAQPLLYARAGIIPARAGVHEQDRGVERGGV